MKIKITETTTPNGDTNYTAEANQPGLWAPTQGNGATQELAVSWLRQHLLEAIGAQAMRKHHADVVAANQAATLRELQTWYAALEAPRPDDEDVPF